MLRAGAGPPLEGSVRALRLPCLLPCLLASLLACLLPSFLPSLLPSLLPSSHASSHASLHASSHASLHASLHASSLASSHLASPPSSPPACIPACMGPQDNTAYDPCTNPQYPSHACQHGPPTNHSFRSPLTSLEGTTNLSSCMGLSTIIRHGAIYHRTVWDHRLSHG